MANPKAGLARRPNSLFSSKLWRTSAMTVSILLLLLVFTPVAVLAQKQSSPTAESLERRQKVQLMAFFSKDPKDAELPSTNLSIQYFNEAVAHYEKNEYDLARDSLNIALQTDPSNAFAYELIGDIDYLQQKLSDAKKNYEMAYNLSASESLKKKLTKVRSESKVERKFATYKEKNFIIKYNKGEVNMEGFELRELLRSTYRQISRSFAYYFKHKVVVLLYDEEEFKKITGTPHWVAGLYDGKIRMPAGRKGFSQKELHALTTHEVTHAFVSAMAGKRAPAWINEGLAQYEENKIDKIDMTVFNAAIKTKSLLPLEQVLSHQTQYSQDPLYVTLFYRQSFHLVNYLIDRYGMFRLKKVLAKFAEGKKFG